MNHLKQAIDIMLRWTTACEKDRAKALQRLEALVGHCQQARQIWQEQQDRPAPVTVPGEIPSLITWMGSVPVKQLFEINLLAKDDVAHLCALAGPEVSRFAHFDEDLIAQGFRNLGPDDSAPTLAREALAQMDARIEDLQALTERLRKARLAAPKAAKASVKKAVAKKLPARKAPAKPVRKAVKKGAAAKKAVARKAPAKAAAKKAPAKSVKKKKR